MQEEFFKIVGIIIVIVFFIYLVVKSLKLQTSIIEGLTNPEGDANVTDFSVNNSGSNVKTYTTKITSEFSKLKDSLNVDKYRIDYENLIVQLDDYLGALMTKEILNIDGNSITEEGFLKIINKLNELNMGRQSLNTTMKFIDGLK
jgi:hypothetical protein